MSGFSHSRLARRLTSSFIAQFGRAQHKFINQLAHFTDFDPTYRLSIPSNKLFVYNIASSCRSPTRRLSPPKLIVPGMTGKQEVTGLGKSCRPTVDKGRERRF